MTNDMVTKEPMKDVVPFTPDISKAFSLIPKDLSEAMRFSEMIAKSAICPTQFKDKPGDVLVAVQMGLEVGLAPLQAIQNIAVINGRPTIWGDAALGVVLGSKAYEWHKEEMDADGSGATFTIKRKGNPTPFTARFTVVDAQKAGLWGKQGPWTNYPKRMLQMRARGFGLRDGFADVLRGLTVREEIEDYVDTTSTPVRRFEEPRERPAAPAAAAPAPAPMEPAPIQAAPAPTSPPLDAAGAADQNTLEVSILITDVKMFRKAGEPERFEITTRDHGVFDCFDVMVAKRAKVNANSTVTMIAKYWKREGKNCIADLK